MRGRKPCHYGMVRVGDYQVCLCCAHNLYSNKCKRHGFPFTERWGYRCKDYSENGVPTYMIREMKRRCQITKLSV